MASKTTKTTMILTAITFGLILSMALLDTEASALELNPTIKITKNVTNADGAFDFTIVNATNPGNSTAVSIPNTAISNMTFPLTVQPGTYNVTETVPAGWTLDAADCRKNNISLGTVLNFTVSLGDSVDCIFENTKTSVQTINATKDSFLRSGNSNTNEGVNPNMIVRASGDNRALVSFNMTSFTGPIDNAMLRLFIVHNANNWGIDGRPIDVHRVTETWVEGNGANLKPGNLSQSEFNPFKNRGNGDGVTWKCVIDSEINNQQANCDPKWNGGTFVANSTDSVTITKGLVDQFIEFDVTSDVNACVTEDADECNWIIKKPNGQSGRVEFATKEGAATIYDQESVPRLIVN